MPRKAPYGYVRTVLAVTVPFTTFLSQTAAQANLVLSKAFGASVELEKVEIVPTTVGTGAGASRVINVRKGNATGTIIGTVTATLANQGTLGVVTAGTVTTAAGANKLNDDGTATPDTLTIETPTGGTVFTAGGLELLLTFRQLAQRAA
jgi:uncharacterized protein (DUF697 family)